MVESPQQNSLHGNRVNYEIVKCESFFKRTRTKIYKNIDWSRECLFLKIALSTVQFSTGTYSKYLFSID